MLNNNNIKIAMLEMSPQNKAILEFYFDRAGKGHYSVVNEDNADAYIIDYDQFGAKEHVSEILADRKIPILLISIREKNVPDTVWVAKPLSADALNKAAASVKELMVEFKDQVKALEAEAEKATATKEEVDSFEILTESHIEKEEEEESLLDDSFKEFDAAIENTTSEKLLEIDEMSFEENTLEDSTVEEITVEKNGVKDSTLEKNSAKKSKTADAGLAIAGLAASALVTSNLVATEDESESDLFEFDVLDTENNADENLTTEIADISTDTADIELENENEVDNLLDSLILEDDEEIDIEPQIEDNNKADEGDIFLDSLLSEQELETDFEENINDTSLELDVLQSVDSELEDNFDLQNSLNIDDAKNHFIEEEKEALVDENFTLHDDLDPSTEDVFADTLEINYAEVKTNEKDVQSESTESFNNEFEELSLDTKDLSTEQESIAESDLDENLDGDFNFDFETLETETNEVATAESEDEFELTLLDEVDAKDTNEKNGATDSIEDILDSDLDDGLDDILDSDLNDSLDTDLDSLLQEVSVENDESLAEENDSESELATEDAIMDKLATADLELNDSVSAEDNDDILGDDLSDTDLQSLLNEVREEASASTSGIAVATVGESAYEQTEAEKRWMQLCGNEPTIKNQKDLSKITFDPNKHLLAVILEQINAPKDDEHLFRLKYKDLIIVIDHSQSKVYCNTHITSDEYSVYCTNEIDPENIKIHDLDYSEERLYRSKIEKNPQRAHSFESFIWTTSLLTSRGRLPENTNVTKNIGLKTWPNLTRLESIPNAMNMAAVFAKHPGTLLEIPNWLKIQQRYVFAFYNACLSLDMIELDANKLKKSGFSFGKKTSNKKSEERGFFGRLLNRLKT